nr:MAG TPA: hypothetical protein [Caudoviricetes sp.]
MITTTNPYISRFSATLVTSLHDFFMSLSIYIYLLFIYFKYL